VPKADHCKGQWQCDREEQEFRTKLRSWLQENVPKGKRPCEGTALRDYNLAWQRKQFDGGWAGISWPKEYGGLGLSADQQIIWYEECARAGAPVCGALFVALPHAGPTLIMRGTEAQKRFHLPKNSHRRSRVVLGFF
jgi:alkylation response protein AidB-like acyl-CoA dehydrogenase